MSSQPRALLAALALGTLASISCGVPPQAVCGDGVAQQGEACDDGNDVAGDGCESDCQLTVAVCGNGTKELDEECDDGDQVAGDGCEPDCRVTVTAVCGNGTKELGEECDDNNLTPGDGCEPDCRVTVAVCGNGTKEPGEECDDNNLTPGDGCESDCTLSPSWCGNSVKEPGEACDDGNLVGGDGCETDCTLSGGDVEQCPGAALPPPQSGTCEVSPGDASRLVTGIILTPGKVLKGGQVLFDGDGNITCVACDCSTAPGAATATWITCPKGVVSPGLINAHDHITFQAAPYTTTSDERYEHRHDWRRGNDGHTIISNGGSASNAMIRWGELRQLMAGTTSVAGSGGQNGLLRNLDKANASSSGGNQEGLGIGATGLRYETFPLGDSGGQELTSGCGYSSIDPPSVIPSDAAYLPHIAEGIEASARNELLCLSSSSGGGQDLIGPRTGIIHGIGVKAVDVATIAADRASLIWSPRSNIVLYGDTAPVAMYYRMGVNIGLGTDWVRSGSMNLLRELRCADSLNTTYLGKTFSDERLWRMATSGAAQATQTHSKIGTLAAGMVADLAVFRQRGEATYRSVIEAEPDDVVLTIRGGKVLYGDQPLVNALTAESCDALTVCGAQKAVCLLGETGESLATLSAANAGTYPLFFCGAPSDEPSCKPERSARNVKNQSTAYTGEVVGAVDADGDGVPDAQDNCPAHFNPVRPLDDGKQADGDADGKGDVCDRCPLNPGIDVCAAPNPDDLDGDGKPSALDNCPSDYNPSQADADNDGKGDVCDLCPAPNPGTAPCPVTIYDLKSSSTMVGQRVSLGGALVTAVGASGFFLQVHEAEAQYTGPDHSGIYVYKPTSGLTAGDRVDVTGTAQNYYGQLQLSGVTVSAPVSTGNPLPAPIVVTPAEISTGGARAQQLEGVLVTVSNVTVTAAQTSPGAGQPNPTNEFEVDSTLRVNGFLYLLSPYVEVGEVFASITGVAELRNEHHKLEPRGPTDFAFGPPSLADFGPAPAYTREGRTGTTLGQPLEVKLRRTQGAPVTVTVTSPSADLLVGGGGVVIPAGQLSAPVELTGVTMNASVTLTATLGTSVRTATVRVLGASEPSTLASLEPSAATAAPGGTVTFTVGLDVPAAAETTVSLTVTGSCTAPATVSIPADAMSATFQLAIDAAATGTCDVTAGLGADARSATVTIRQGSGLVINEIDYDQPLGDDAEFIELLNNTAAPIDLANLYLVFVNGSNKTEYFPGATARLALSGAGAQLGPGQYLVVGLSTVTSALPSGVLSITLTGTSIVQNGNPDAVGILDASQGKLLDSLSYGGAVNGVALGGQSYDFQEGASSTAALTDSNSVAGSLARSPNGADTDDNAADFQFTSTPTPGAANQ